MIKIHKENKKLPKSITSYDLLKTFAIITMIIDHVGYYFFPEQLWFRAIGRLCVPAWLFLIGYSKSKDITVTLIAGAIILMVANFVVGIYVFPANILATIIISRLIIDFVMKIFFKDKISLYFICFTFFILVIPSYLLFEYGSLAFIMVMFGWLVRNKKEGDDKKIVDAFMMFSLLSFVIYQQVYFGFDNAQTVFLVLGVIAVNLVLYYFRPHEFVELTNRLNGGVVWFIQACGRHTLEIYVAHLIIFKFTALYLGYEGYGLFEFKLVDWSFFDTSVE